jgi:hypothetical protein
MNDERINQYIETAIKMGALSPEDFGGMTWEEIVKFIQQLISMEENESRSRLYQLQSN